MRLDEAEADGLLSASAMVSEDSAFLVDSLKSAQEEIEMLRNEVAAFADRRSEWMAMLSHELRTPLCLIAGYGRLLLSGEGGPLTEKQCEYLNEGLKNYNRLEALIEKMLDVVDANSVKESLEFDFHAPDDLVLDVLAMMAPIFESSDIQLAVDIEPGLPECRLDRLRVEQVLTNLFQNAARVTKSGGSIFVSVRKTSFSGKDAAGFSVSDEGPGVPQHHRERIFEPFVQLGPPTGQLGLGLGLTICRRIVDAHGGKLGVDDALGGGSRFFLVLPIGGHRGEMG